MEDIVARLRDPLQSMTQTACRKLMDEAASEIERRRDNEQRGWQKFDLVMNALTNAAAGQPTQ